jgi:hypothetical protein
MGFGVTLQFITAGRRVAFLRLLFPGWSTPSGFEFLPAKGRFPDARALIWREQLIAFYDKGTIVANTLGARARWDIAATRLIISNNS